jgi:prepilin peptidase CpaA
MLHPAHPDILAQALPVLWTAALLVPLPLLAWAAWSDLLSRTIPDQACIVLAATGLAVRGSSGAAPLALSAGIAALAFLALAALHARGGFGGGDVKLIAAVLLGLSPLGAYRFLVITILAGGVLAVIHLALRALPPAPPAPAGAVLPWRLWRAERWRVRRQRTLPFGIANAGGGCWAVVSGIGG